MVLLGPSGCGKTTFLRIICGLEKQTSGDLLIDGNVVNDIPPRARGVAMMFQSYGLYPHFSVRHNIAFPLRTQRVPRAEIEKKVEWASQLLGIGLLLNRQPRQLSGGERQRVGTPPMNIVARNGGYLGFAAPNISSLFSGIRT